MSNPTRLLHVIIRSPKQVIFEGEAAAVSSTNSAGKFDILPEHANFITMTENAAIIIHSPDGKSITYNLPLSIIYNTGNTVKIYTDILSK